MISWFSDMFSPYNYLFAMTFPHYGTCRFTTIDIKGGLHKFLIINYFLKACLDLSEVFKIYVILFPVNFLQWVLYDFNGIEIHSRLKCYIYKDKENSRTASTISSMLSISDARFILVTFLYFRISKIYLKVQKIICKNMQKFVIHWISTTILVISLTYLVHLINFMALRNEGIVEFSHEGGVIVCSQSL